MDSLKALFRILQTEFAADYRIVVTFAVIGGNKNTKTANFYYTQGKQLET